MLDITTRDGPKPKCYYTHANLPNFVDHEQPPTKKKPFSTVGSQTFSHTLDVVVPEDAAPKLLEALGDGKGTLRYARVYMKLGDIIEGDFFNQYIKTGNILMLAEGRPGIDHIYCLAEGTLRLEVDKPTFERMGLEGTAIPNEGRKHVKARFAIEINLRLPSMVKGKSGFDRVVWAFRNVLNHSVAWLFRDLMAGTDGTGPLAAHQPLIRSVEPSVQQLDNVIVPAVQETFDQDGWLDAMELLEWLILVTGMSPRVQQHDAIDPYLSRYGLPGTDGMVEEGDGRPRGQGIMRYRWHGFIPAGFVTKIFLAALKASGSNWVSVSATSFNGEAYTILKDGERTLTWEYMD